MAAIPSPTAEALQGAWKMLAGGDLAIVVGDAEPTGGIHPRRFPACVRKSLQRRESLAGERVRSRSWWVSASPTASSERIQIVAWTSKPGKWMRVLQSWTDLLGTLVEERLTSEGLTEELISAWDRLAFLYELARIASGPSDLGEMLGAIVRLLSQVVSAEDVFLVIQSGGILSSVTASKRPLEDAGILLASVQGARRPLTLEEVRDDLERSGTEWTRSGDLLVAPVLAGSARGAIGLIGRVEDRFDANDLQLLASVAEQVNALVESAEARSAQMERERLDHELALAADLQVTLLPLGLPAIPGYQLAAYLRPARRVGGDFYDAVVTDSGDVLFLLADVAGKGMPAALLTALVRAVFRGECAHHREPGSLLSVMNQSLFADLHRMETFVTAVVVRVSPGGKPMAYASAGHVDLGVCRVGSAALEYLPATGLPLGIEPVLTCDARPLALGPGDTLVVYSDGVTDAEAPDGSLFGVQGLEDIIYAAHLATADGQVRAIVDGLEAHRAERPLRDDVALLLVKSVVPDAPAADVTPFVIPATLSSVAGAVAFARDDFRRHVPPEEQAVVDDFGLALSEIITNQVQHAYAGSRGMICGRLTSDGKSFRADLFDRGTAFNPPEELDSRVDPENPPDRGYGLRLARALVDECEYHRLEGGRNHWRLLKRLRGADRP